MTRRLMVLGYKVDKVRRTNEAITMNRSPGSFEAGYCCVDCGTLLPIKKLDLGREEGIKVKLPRSRNL